MEVLSHSSDETKKLAERIAKDLKPGEVLALYGDLGSGKTTFTRYLVGALGFSARVQSPTFVISRKYSRKGGNIKVVNHIDLYRLQNKKEVLDLGLEELFSEGGAVSVIEWPELAKDLLPPRVKRIYFEYVDENSRRFIINL